MPLQTINLDCVSWERIWNYSQERCARFPHYRGAQANLYDAYQAARRNKLRFNRKTHVLRDDRLGVISRPKDPMGLAEASVDAARLELISRIWCDAVRAHNKE